jgi:hypothetical protein
MPTRSLPMLEPKPSDALATAFSPVRWAIPSAGKNARAAARANPAAECITSGCRPSVPGRLNDLGINSPLAGSRSNASPSLRRCLGMHVGYSLGCRFPAGQHQAFPIPRPKAFLKGPFAIESSCKARRTESHLFGMQLFRGDLAVNKQHAGHAAC